MAPTPTSQPTVRTPLAELTVAELLEHGSGAAVALPATEQLAESGITLDMWQHESSASSSIARLLAINVVAIAVLGLLANSLLPSNGQLIEPGSVTPMTAALELDPPQAADRLTGSMVTVSLRSIGAVERRFWERVAPERVSETTNQQTGIEMVYDSFVEDRKVEAIYAGAKAAGADVSLTSEGVIAYVVEPGFPAHEAGLRPGEVITAINGKPARFATDVDALRDVQKEGAPVTLDVVGRSEPIRMKAGVRGVLGVFAHAYRPRIHGLDLGVEYTIDFDGDSAGLSTALSIAQALGVGGDDPPRWAATGAVDHTGTVELVSYVEMKTQLVAAAGARYFLVSPGNEEQARSAAPDGLEVVAVETIDDAVEWLRTHE